MKNFLRTSPNWPMALARIVMGLMWLATLRWKLPPDFDGSDSTRGLREWVDLMIEHPTFGWYGDLIDSLVEPNFTLFAWLVLLAELFVAVALITGIAIRPAALLGLLMSFNLFLGVQNVPGEWVWTYVLMMAFHAAIFISPKAATWAIRPEALWPDRLRPLSSWPTDTAATMLRVTLGVVTLVTWKGNIDKDFYDGEKFPGFFDWVFKAEADGGNGSSLGFVQSIVDATLLQAPEFFGWILTFLELFIAIGLIFGIFTRAASLAAVAFFGNLFLVYFGGHEWIFIYVMLTLAAAISFLNWGGRTAGVDQAIAARRGESPATLLW